MEYQFQLIRNDLNAPILRTVAENFVKISADLLPRNPWLLLSAPPAYLLKQSKYEHFLYAFIMSIIIVQCWNRAAYRNLTSILSEFSAYFIFILWLRQ